METLDSCSKCAHVICRLNVYRSISPARESLSYCVRYSPLKCPRFDEFYSMPLYLITTYFTNSLPSSILPSFFLSIICSILTCLVAYLLTHLLSYALPSFLTSFLIYLLITQQWLVILTKVVRCTYYGVLSRISQGDILTP